MNLVILSVLLLVNVAVAEIGLSFRPHPRGDTRGRSLIWYTGSNQTDIENYKESLDHFLAPYKTPGITPGRRQTIYNCSFDRLPGKRQVCNVNIRDFGACQTENYYGYHKDSPCIFLKYNKINGWKPGYYNKSDELPNNMPRDLKQYIKELDNLNKHLNTIWVSCEGEMPFDIENIGPVSYFPQRGFPGYYYPYENAEGYLEPLVAVHFERPAKNVLINIECKAWAKNLQHGSLNLQIMVD